MIPLYILVVEIGQSISLRRSVEAHQMPNAIEHLYPERSSVSALAASDAVSLSFLRHDVESACAKIGRQARRLIQGVLGQNWRTFPLQIFRPNKHRRSVGGA